MKKEVIEKNKLDLEHNRHTQYFNTTVIISFTYLVGVVIAFITEEIDYTSLTQLKWIALTSIGVLGLMTILLLVFRSKAREALSKMEELKERL